eukprot:scaffold586_cov59-Phaeocystis_antarctica.AAC.3
MRLNGANGGAHATPPLALRHAAHCFQFVSTSGAWPCVAALHCGPALKHKCTLPLPFPLSRPPPPASCPSTQLTPLPNATKHAVPPPPSLHCLSRVSRASKAGRPTAPVTQATVVQPSHPRTTAAQPAPAEDASGAGVHGEGTDRVEGARV